MEPICLEKVNYDASDPSYAMWIPPEGKCFVSTSLAVVESALVNAAQTFCSGFAGIRLGIVWMVTG